MQVGVWTYSMLFRTLSPTYFDSKISSSRSIRTSNIHEKSGPLKRICMDCQVFPSPCLLILDISVPTGFESCSTSLYFDVGKFFMCFEFLNNIINSSTSSPKCHSVMSPLILSVEPEPGNPTYCPECLEMLALRFSSPE